MVITRILCPSDFSDASTHAIEQAFSLAGYYKSGITALHVLSPLRLAVAGAATSEDEAHEIDRFRRCVTNEFVAAKSKKIRLDVLVHIGQPATVILERAASLPADLIVMGTHGTGGFQHLVLGSVTEKVLRRARCPVLTVPPRAHTTAGLPFKRLLCAVDFSEVSLKAVRSAISLARESHATLTLLNVLEWPWDEPPAPRPDELPTEQGAALNEFRRYVEHCAMKRLDSLVPDSLNAPEASTRIESGKPYVQILKIAAEEGSDLVVMGARGRNPVDLMLFGSTTNQLVRRATCPVLTVH